MGSPIPRETPRPTWPVLPVFLPVLLLSLASLLLMPVGCATVGHAFPVESVSRIRMNETTQDEIRTLFGPPWRTGIEDGRVTWTYGRYRYRLFGETETTDLVLRFDDRGVVVSYTFNTTEHPG